MINLNDPQVWWFATRASAILAWVLLTVSLVLGVLLRTRIMRGADDPDWLKSIHRFSSSLAVIMVVIHLVTLYLDEYIEFEIGDLLIPFQTDYKTDGVAVGIFAVYLLVAVVLSSWMMNSLPQPLWKFIHFGSYGILFLTAVHAGMVGYDTNQTWYQIVAVTLIVLGVSAALVRYLIAVAQRKRQLAEGKPAATRAVFGLVDKLALRVVKEIAKLDHLPGEPASSGASAVATSPRVATSVAPSVSSFEATSRIESRAPQPSLTRLAKPADVEDFAELPLAVTARRLVAKYVVELTFAAMDGSNLWEWAPGAHITLHLPNGLQRQYSLCGDPADRNVLKIAVRNSPTSAGGSKWLMSEARPGLVLTVERPRNHFALKPAHRYQFVAGGIGITPIMAMIESLPSSREWTLIYLGRSRENMAYLEELVTKHPGRVFYNISSEAGRANVKGFIDRTAMVYCCGPATLVDDIEQIVDSKQLVVERFNPVERVSTAAIGELTVNCSSSGVVVKVAQDETILDAVLKAGVSISSSCKKGVCGNCETRILAGTPEHLDSVMSDSDKDELGVFYPCVSRAKTTSITIDA